MTPLIPRRHRETLRAAQAEADAALRSSVDSLHSEVVQAETTEGRRQETQRIADRMLHWQHRNHFAENFRRELGEAR
jgi:hypothetical protein